jgi:hypothetical protein
VSHPTNFLHPRTLNQLWLHRIYPNTPLVRLIYSLQSQLLIMIRFRLKDALQRRLKSLALPSTADALADLPDAIASLIQGSSPK